MKVKFLGLTVAIIMVTGFAGSAYADSCATGSFGNLVGTSCTSGDIQFTFSSEKLIEDVDLDLLTFTPIWDGFSLSGFPSIASSQNRDDEQFYLQQVFSVLPVNGSVSSVTVTLQGVTINALCCGGEDLAAGFDGSPTGPLWADNYFTQNGVTTHTNNVSRGPLTGGTLIVEGYAYDIAGSESFTSADFVFNTVPEGPKAWIFGITALGIALSLLWKYRQGSPNRL